MNKKRLSPKIIDVRNPDEFKKGHAPGSLNIPLPELEERLKEIQKIKQPLIVVCGGGTRNGKGAEVLKGHGINAEAGGGWKNFQ